MRLRWPAVRLLEDLFEDGSLVLNALMDMLEFKVAGTQRDGLGDALGDQPGFDAAETGERNGGAVMRVESLGLDETLAEETESALVRGLGDRFLRRLPCSGGSGKDEQLAIGENAVYIEKQ